MKSNGGEGGQATSDYAGWLGLHYIVGFVFRLRGIDIKNEALGQAAKATHPLVNGKLPMFLNVLGTYGGVLADIVGEQDGRNEGMENRDIELGPDAGHRNRPEEQNSEDRPQSVGVVDTVTGSDGDSGDVQMDGADLRW